MFKEIHFFNDWHNGDIHLSRGIIKNVIQHYPEAICFFHHKHGNKSLQDLPVIYSEEIIDYPDIVTIIDDKLYINTWMGKFLPNGKQLCSWGCNCESNKQLLNHILEVLGKNKFLINELDLIPFIDFSKFDIKNINDFLKNNTNKKILICNGDTMSGQSYNFSFAPYVMNLAIQYENINFILTQKENIVKNNIFYTDDIIKQPKSDLNEIAFLALNCDIVIGRGSGPFVCSQIFESLTDENKTFISFSNKRFESFLTEKTKCNKVWSNNYSPENIMNVLITELNKLEG
jgi:hypothetical protein